MSVVVDVEDREEVYVGSRGIEGNREGIQINGNREEKFPRGWG